MSSNDIIKIGLDFGTHQTKICIQKTPDEGHGEPSYEFFSFDDPEGEKSYFLPSIVQINQDDTLSYGFVDRSKEKHSGVAPKLELFEMPTIDINKEAKRLFEGLGIVETIPTELMDVAGYISGCGPAFVDLFMEAYADAAVKYGVPRATAYKLIAQTLLGSAKLQMETGKHPGELKDAVCSPNGTTICGVAALEKAGFRSACIESIDAIVNKKKNG